MTSKQPQVAIIGAGPAGLTIGLLLHENKIPFTIFELRSKPSDEDFAKPSGSLDLHEESGQAAIKACGLYDDFLPLTGECFQDDIIADKDGNILHSDEGTESDRPEISRHALTRLLLSHVPAEMIKWEHKLISAKTTTTQESTQTELDFGTNGKHNFDLVIGADGAWSKVRQILTSVKPHYSGVHCVTATVHQVSEKTPHLAEFIGRGTFMALGMGHGVCSQRGGNDTARMYNFISTPDEHFAKTTGLSDLTPAQAKDKLLTDDKLLATWSPKLKDLVSVACDSETRSDPTAKLDIKPLYTLPIGHKWDHVPGVTVIGDASHLMPPFAGEGVNQAMLDALQLSRAIIKAHDESVAQGTKFQTALDPLLMAFEEEMISRAKEKAEETASNQEMMFSEDGASKMLALFSAHGPGGEGEGEKVASLPVMEDH